MDLALITAQQVAELFILMGLGALGAKTGLLRPEGKQTLSNLLVNLVVPAMIINSYRMDFKPRDPPQSSGCLRPEHPVQPAGPCHHPAVHGPQQGQPDPHLPVRLRLLQCRLHGPSPHLGVIWFRGPALRQRLLYHLQSSALDAGLQHRQRQL